MRTGTGEGDLLPDSFIELSLEVKENGVSFVGSFTVKVVSVFGVVNGVETAAVVSAPNTGFSGSCMLSTLPAVAQTGLAEALLLVKALSVLGAPEANVLNAPPLAEDVAGIEVEGVVLNDEFPNPKPVAWV